MKKTLLFVYSIVCLSLLSGCSMLSMERRDAKYNYTKIQSGAFNDTVPVAVKDFEVKGVVFVESKVVYDMESGEKNGSEITFTDLMREAVKLGADDIINVRIDKTEYGTAEDKYRKDSIRDREVYAGRDYTSKNVVYKATAIAIKYTKALETNFCCNKNAEKPVIDKKINNTFTEPAGEVKIQAKSESSSNSRTTRSSSSKNSSSKNSNSSKEKPYSVFSSLTDK